MEPIHYIDYNDLGMTKIDLRSMAEFRTMIVAKRVVEKCVEFANNIHATRLSDKLVFKQVVDATKISNVDPEHVYDHVRIALENEGIELKE